MKYYVNTDEREDGSHVMHAEYCQYLPNPESRKAVGDYANCDTGLKHARKVFDGAKPCRTCCSDCSG
ncbi:hypothetical protein [Palleronia abyssalis]|uniref:Uncharacterized protein n=1 Tax=Palleronia abyssalis TaxID=1501240 RepID=A0A2R8BXE2_9RHOB|nr:hypothetical protein [Palleronia abyssalis]SPJ24819.1 hypothetical protein PAA8504_02658 [Palleronia abyssalis]